ncbi:hypothetical protein CVT25_012489 [Psilocybe cyanescens]|uniref:G domain-containing protein n=1 Tax=Psilocybe cyanescens TaxID=93625 RepID=A0A409XFQ0_PSICY|nr:hypothetical protein CVT25_012489 [Psilocybe cyanescens]
MKNNNKVLDDARTIVIPIMGATGVGKSTFINKVAGQNLAAVGHEIESCTAEIQIVDIGHSVFLDAPWLKNRRLCLVDTPGFDDTYKDDVEILETIATWLKSSYKENVLGGVIYLHDLSIDRYTDTAKKNLNMFCQLCGMDALDRVIVGATKANRLNKDAALNRLERLKETHWKEMMKHGSHIFLVDDDPRSALQIVKAVLRLHGEKFERQHYLADPTPRALAPTLGAPEPTPQAPEPTPRAPDQNPAEIGAGKIMLIANQACNDPTSLAIQHELVDQGMIILETAAGKELRYTLRQVLEHQKKFAQLSGKGMVDDLDELAEAKREIEKLSKQRKELKVPLVRRLLRFWHLFPQGDRSETDQ